MGKLLSISLILVVIFSTLSIPAYSHFDNQSDKAFHTTVILKKLSFYEGARTFYDLGSEADIVVGWKAELTGHPDATKTGTFSFDDVPINDIDDIDLNTVMLDHYECSPLGDFKIYSWAAESDQDDTLDTEKLMKDIVSTSSGQVQAKQKIESAGDTFIGYGTKLARPDDSLSRDERELKTYLDFEKTVALRAVMIREHAIEFDKQCENLKETALLLPSWFKSNTNWWIQGSISDQDIILAIENLIEQNIIHIRQVDHKTQSPITDSKIPSYIKNVFGFWSQDQVSDSEIASSMQYLIEHGIIKSKKLSQTQSIPYPALDDPEKLKDLYLANSWLEYASQILLEIKGFEQSFLDDLSDDAWKQYAESKDKELMEQAQEIEEASKKANEQASEAVKIFANVKENSKKIEKAANDAGVHTLDLERHIEQVTSKIDSIEGVGSEKDLENAYKEGAKAIDNAKKKPLRFDASISELLFEDDKKALDRLFHEEAFRMREWFEVGGEIDDDELGESIPPDEPSVESTPAETATKVISKHGTYEIYGGADLCDDNPIDYEVYVKFVISKPIKGNAKIGLFFNDVLTAEHFLIPIEDGEINLVTSFAPGKHAFKLIEVEGYTPSESDKVEVVIPLPDCSKPDDSFVAPPEPEGKMVTVLVIGFEKYPVLQFVSAHPDACSVFHYHSPYSRVYSVDLISISDPAKPKCGFGPVDSIPVTEVFMTQAQIDAFVAATGLSP
jgi:hypothetical protein